MIIIKIAYACYYFFIMKESQIAVQDSILPRRRTRWEDGDSFRVNRKELSITKQKFTTSR